MSYKKISKSLSTNFLTALLLIIVVVPAAAAGNLAISHSLEASGITVCHKTGLHNQKTIDIDDADLADHLGHGDLEGQCTPLQATVI